MSRTGFDGVRGPAAHLRAVATAALAVELTWSPDGDERFGLAADAPALARSTGDLATLGVVLRAHDLTIAAADTLAERRRATEELLAVAAVRGAHGLAAAAARAASDDR